MPYTEFGIIDCINKEKDYSEYEPVQRCDVK